MHFFKKMVHTISRNNPHWRVGVIGIVVGNFNNNGKYRNTMEIKIKSQAVNNPEELLDLISTSDKSEVTYKILEIPKGKRPLITVAAVITGLSTLGAGGIVVALINAIKDHKIKKMELKSAEKQNEEDRKLKREELEASKETEILKLEAERKKIALQGYIEIAGNYINTILKENKDDKISILEKLGFKFEKDKVVIPANIDLNQETIENLESVLEVTAINEIVHIENN